MALVTERLQIRLIKFLATVRNRDDVININRELESAARFAVTTKRLVAELLRTQFVPYGTIV